MIVKKVKYTQTTKPKAWQIGDLLDYIRNAHHGETHEKVTHFGARNFLTADHEAQKREMIALAQESIRSRMPVSHWIFSWREEEQPSPEQVEELVDIFLREMGFEECQCAFALHHNTDNYHVHVAINRVHPEHLKVLRANYGFDIRTAQKALAIIEQTQGWQPEKNARYAALEDGSITPVHREEVVQPDAQARTLEHLTGEKSAQRLAQEKALPILQNAASWAELHAQLGAANMRFEKKGSGAILWVGDVAIKASSVHRSCSLGSLCKRWGVFAPATEPFVPVPQEPEPVSTVNHEEWKAYQAEIHGTAQQPEAAEHSAATRHRKRPRLRRRPTFKAWLRAKGLHRAASRWRYRLHIDPPPQAFAAPCPADPALPQQEFARYFAALGAERVRVTCIRMREDGEKQAMILDKRDGVSQGFTPQELVAHLPEMLRLQARGENIYYTPLSETKHYILVDDMSRKRVSAMLSDGYKPAVVLESSPGNYQCLLSIPKAKTPFDRDIANRLSRELNQKYGDPELSGAIHPHRAPAFENRKPKHRQEDGTYPQVRLLYAKAQECRKAMLEADRIERELAAEQHRRRQTHPAPAPRSVPQTSATAAYYAHYADLRQHMQLADLSRVDGMIAVRLRATGHSPLAIAGAIYQCAPTIRDKAQRRDWARYAERTANYAFGAGGDMVIGRYQQRVRSWQRLEARGLAGENGLRHFHP